MALSAAVSCCLLAGMLLLMIASFVRDALGRKEKASVLWELMLLVIVHTVLQRILGTQTAVHFLDRII